MDRSRYCKTHSYTVAAEVAGPIPCSMYVSMHALPVTVLVLSKYSALHPRCKDSRMRLLGNTELSIGVSVSWLSLYVALR